jgi:MYXO-CTERM domain-containing protein
MVKTAILATLLVLAGSPPAWSATLKVGPTQTYAKPCLAVAAAKAGDVIEVEPGVYTDDSCAIAVSLTIRGVGATRPHLKATQPIPNKKGIFAIDVGVGAVTIENLELSGAKISVGDGNNGAAIRAQGSSLTVRNCYIHDNQNGILTGGTASSEITVEGTELAANGNAGSGYEHNIYVSGDCKSFTFSHSYSHHAKSGHNLKSRCKVNRILYSRLMDEATGTASYIIDLPEGGRSYLIGNLIHKGPNAENTGAVMSYKCEGASAPELDLYVVNNTFVSDLGKASMAFVKVCSATTVKLINNLFVGVGSPVTFSGSATSQNNLQLTSAGLFDPAGYDYHLTAASPAVDKGTSPGVGSGEALTPTFQYLHPLAKQPRPIVGSLDVGAYELGSTAVVDGVKDSAGPVKDGAALGDRASWLDRGQGLDAVGDRGPRSDVQSQDADSGCGCAVTGDGEPGLAALVLSVAGLLLVRRRRR